MMNADSHAASAESIAHALEHELETLTQVVETLDIEHEALMGSDAERLEQAVAAKDIVRLQAIPTASRWFCSKRVRPPRKIAAYWTTEKNEQNSTKTCIFSVQEKNV